jgi:phenylalanyl-tRNA synthetase beta chain
LNDYVDVSDVPIDELRRRLDLAGLEVGAIEIVGYPGADLPWHPEQVITAEVVAVRPHPDADRLVLAEVDHGGEENEIVVTGAPSLFHRMGEGALHLKVAFAWEGATLYDGHAEGWMKRTLKKSKIRGVPSRAMVLSEKELGLAEEQTDIIYLPEDTPVGVPLVEILGDYVLDFDIKGPFGHLQSVYGIAREVAALFDRSLHRFPMRAVERLNLTTSDSPDFLALEIADPDVAPRYTATMIRDVEVRPSPLWMRTRLQRAGMRPINNLVDITNYVMLELGEPLHAFDYDDLRPRSGEEIPAIIVRRAHEGEGMTTLDEVQRTFDEEMLLITDGGGPVAVAGVMGGLESEVSAETDDVLLEAASFNFLNVRRTSQLLKVITESSSRFGKRVNPELALPAAARAAELMAELAGGTVERVVGDLYPGKPEPTVIAYDPTLADRLLGVEIAREEQERILTDLEFEVRANEGAWMVTVPSYRQDVTRPADLVEEVARIWGYDRFPRTLIDEPLPTQRRNLSLEGEERVRDIMAGLGLDEVITYTLVDPQDEMRLRAGLSEEESLPLPGEPLTLRNTLSPERSQMRRTLLPGLLRTAWANLRFVDRVDVFEVGRINYRVREPNPDEGDTGVEEPRHLGVLLTGPRHGRWWKATEREPMDYFDLKGRVEAFLRALDLEDEVRWESTDHPAYYPGRAADVWAGDVKLGQVGELHPLVREAFDLPEQPIVLLEWDLEALLGAAGGAEAEKEVGLLSTYPPVYEDLALIVGDEMPARTVQQAILEAGFPLVTRALLFDVYRGAQVGEGRKSLAFALTYQSPGKSLSERDVEKLRKRIIKRLERGLGAELRGG